MMCQCGCTMMGERYRFPGPGKSFYLLTLQPKCENCDAPAGITIELIEPSNVLYEEYKQGDFETEQLEFADWPDSKGVAVVTGFRKHEFVAELKDYLEGLNSKDFGDGGFIDDIGAETILEEMYESSQAAPSLVEPRIDAGKPVKVTVE